MESTINGISVEGTPDDIESFDWRLVALGYCTEGLKKSTISNIRAKALHECAIRAAGKLCDERALKILSLISSGNSHRYIADLLGLSASRIGQIYESVRRKSIHPKYRVLWDDDFAKKVATKGMVTAERVAVAAVAAKKLEEGEAELININLSTATYNCLRLSGITTIERLTQMSEKQIKRIRNMGKLRFNELKQKMDERSLQFKE